MFRHLYVETCIRLFSVQVSTGRCMQPHKLMHACIYKNECIYKEDNILMQQRHLFTLPR